MILFAAMVLIVLIALGFHVATAVGLLAISLSELFAFNPITGALGDVAWSASADFILVAVPMFIMMGQLLLRSGVAHDMYRGLAVWLDWLPGGLMHANIASCALFAASSGSSVATAATIGTMAVPNIKERGYNPRLFLGTLAAGGTLGVLIPPSIPMIVYGVLSETSVVKLYLAALAPGLLLASFFSLATLVICLFRPSWGGVRESSPWVEKFRELIYVIPPTALFLIVIGSIYVGIATPTEAAALGLVASLILAASRRKLTLEILIETFVSTMRTSCMIMLIVLMAFFLNVVMVTMGMTQALIELVSDLELAAPRGVCGHRHFLPRARLFHGNSGHADRDHDHRRAHHRRTRVCSNLVRRDLHDPDRGGDVDTADRGQPIRYSVDTGAGPIFRHCYWRHAVSGNDAAHDRRAGGVSGDCFVAPGSL